MKKSLFTFFLSVAALTIAFAMVIAAQAPPQGGGAPRGGGAAAAPMTLTTNGWMDGGMIPAKYTQAVPMPVSPALTWTNVPAGTQSLVLHFHDPDVSKNNTTMDQVHWLVWNMPPTLTGLPENVPAGAQLPDGSRQISASGSTYRGPGAPAAGPYHHYTFEIYALDIKLDTIPAVTSPVAAGATPNPNDELQTREKVFAAMQGHVRGKAVMTGLFKRPM
jgi:Raf kinase inhibitor-like YbhB/YbcL family protein